MVETSTNAKDGSRTLESGNLQVVSESQTHVKNATMFVSTLKNSSVVAVGDKSPAKVKPSTEVIKQLNAIHSKHVFSGEKDPISAYKFYLIQREVGTDAMLDELKGSQLARFMTGTALVWYDSEMITLQQMSLRGRLRRFYSRFAPRNLEHSRIRLMACTRKSGETVEQYQAQLIVLADELAFIDSMHILNTRVSVTSDELRKQFLDGCGVSEWRRECKRQSCKTLEEAVATSKDLVASEYSFFDSITESQMSPQQINAVIGDEEMTFDQLQDEYNLNESGASNL